MSLKNTSMIDREEYYALFGEGFKGYATFDLEIGYCPYKEGTIEHEIYSEGYWRAEEEFFGTVYSTDRLPTRKAKVLS